MLFVDKLKDPSSLKDMELKVYNRAFDIAKLCTTAFDNESDALSLNIGPARKYMADNASDSFVELTYDMLCKIKDSGMFNYMMSVALYQQKNGKNYVFTKELANILAKTKADIPLKYFPDQFSGYFEIPNLKDLDGCPFLGLFVNIYQGCIQFTGVIRDDGCFPLVYLQLKIDKTKTFKEIIEKSKGFVHKVDRTREEKNLGPQYYSFYHVIGNALAFVCNSEYTLEEERNTFATKIGKLTAQKKIFTSLPYVVVGKGYHGRTYHVDEAVVSGHYRWQPCGPERSKIKLIYINPHVRTFNKENHDSQKTI